MKGIIIFMQAKVGSKSEGVYPYLYVGNAELIKVYFEGDNPFENETLWRYDGEKVVLEGALKENNVFVITEISKDKDVADAEPKETVETEVDCQCEDTKKEQEIPEEEIEGEIV